MLIRLWGRLLPTQVVPLKLGMIGVVNRSQYDIDHRKTIGDARAEEDAFFASHYSSLKHRCGVNYLAATLNKVGSIHRHTRTGTHAGTHAYKQTHARTDMHACIHTPTCPHGAYTAASTVANVFLLIEIFVS